MTGDLADAVMERDATARATWLTIEEERVLRREGMGASWY